MTKFKVDDVIVGKTIDGWGFGKAAVKKIIGYSMVDDNEAYEAEVLEATANFPVGTTVIVKNYDCAFYRSAAPKSYAPKVNARELVGASEFRNIQANGKVWTIRALAEAVLRKMMPVGTVAKNYFPLGDRARAAVAWLGNEKHNPGQELHWAEGKSNDHLDCAGRHLTESDDWDVTVLPDGRAFAVLHTAQLAWRASALAELAARKYGGMVIVQLEVPQGGENALGSPTGDVPSVCCRDTDK